MERQGVKEPDKASPQDRELGAEELKSLLTSDDPAEQPRNRRHFCHIVCVEVVIAGGVEMAAVAEVAPQVGGHGLVVHSECFSAGIKLVAP